MHFWLHAENTASRMRFGKPAETPRSHNILFDNIIHQNTGKKTLKMALKRTVNAYVICFEMDSKMEMMKMQIQYVIKMKISELELLEK